MFHSFPIGHLFGIPVRLHSLFVVMLFVVMTFEPRLGMLLPILFGCVLLHELGHALVAQRMGIRVLDITLWPLGGMARMNTIPEEPRTEALISIAGPAVNFVLAAVALPLAFLGGIIGALAQFFVLANLLMGVFNLLPAFPMDGGRLLRAYLGRSRDWVSATEQAVRVGRIFAILMLLAWPFFQFNLVLPLIALFVWYTGSQELLGVRLRHGLSPFGTFGDRSRPFPGFGGFGRRRPEPAPQEQGATFGPFRPPGAAQGAPPRGAAVDGLGDGNGHTTAASGSSAEKGFSAEKIERLERFHGPLRQYRADESAS